MDAEAEYNNRARVPDSAAIIARWMRDAQDFRSTWPHRRLDVRYGDTEPELLDLFLPAEGGDCPLAMFIHGGYWQALDRTAVSHFARGLLMRGVAAQCDLPARQLDVEPAAVGAYQRLQPQDAVGQVGDLGAQCVASLLVQDAAELLAP